MERRAFVIARLATGNDDDALDLVQESMLRLVKRYGSKPPTEWPALFHTILQSAIRDHYRRQTVRNRWRVFWSPSADAPEEDPTARHADPCAIAPDQNIDRERGIERIHQALEALPLRQQQAFVLRTWEGLSTEETARAMKLSTGSVKTHLSRARPALQQQLQEFAP